MDWFRIRNQQWIDAWTDGYTRYAEPESIPPDVEHLAMPHLLEVSAEGDGAILLLNPLVIHGDGEWEAWSFANWHPGAERFRSFWDLMKERVDTFDCPEAE